MKKKFEYMSTSEWLGDATTHFMKSGETFRSNENSHVNTIGQLIPRIANGVKVEYDISYDIPNKICGYKITDFLTKAVTIAPNSMDFAWKNISEVARWKSTDEGFSIFEQLKTGISDKYIQDDVDDESECKELIVLPGTNILVKDGAVDFEKLDLLIYNGAKVKLHPITSKVWRTMLTKRWGKENVISADDSLYHYLRICKKVYFMMSSETGFSSIILGKQIGILPSIKHYNLNFSSFYKGLDRCQDKSISLKNKMIALLSNPESGVITCYHSSPKEAIEQYFDHMKKFPHEIKK